MAFPTSPSNNQVHSEGNRKWVWDSASSTWDQVGESAGVQSPYNHLPGSVVQVTRGFNGDASTATLSDLGHSATPVTALTEFVYGDITPHYYDSKILVMWNVRFSCGGADFHAINLVGEIFDPGSLGRRRIVAANQSGNNRYRSTYAGQMRENHNANDYALNSVSDQWLDDPRESMNFVGNGQKLRYTVVIGRYTAGGTVYINRTITHRDHADGYDGCNTCTMTLMEVKQ